MGDSDRAASGGCEGHGGRVIPSKAKGMRKENSFLTEKEKHSKKGKQSGKSGIIRKGNMGDKDEY